jgi:hypothetical protein
MNNLTLKDELTEFLLYTTPNSDVKVEIFLHNESVWLPQKRMAELFGVERSVITKHLKNIFDSAELDEDSVSAKIAHTAKDGKNYQIKNGRYFGKDYFLVIPDLIGNPVKLKV